MTTRLKEIVETIKSQKDVLFAQAAFRYYIDNQITEDELIEVLAEDNIALPDNFKELTIREKKSYYNTVQTRIYFEDNDAKNYSYLVFNKPYFYDLAEHARKNISLTKDLIEYFRILGEHNVNLMFLGMQYIKIKNTVLSRQTNINNYIELKKKNKTEISDIYTLLVTAFSDSKTQENKQLRNLLIKEIGKDTLLGFDINPEHKNKLFCLFALYVECALSLLPRKEANTVKIKFRVLEPYHLRGDLDYYSDAERQARIVNTFKKKVKSDRILTQLSGFILDNQETFDQFGPNGYTAIYYYLMEEGV